METEQDDHESHTQLQMIPSKITSEELKYIDPLTIDRKQLDQLKVKLDKASQARINLQIDCNSPRTKQAIKNLNLNEEEIAIRDRTEFIVVGDNVLDREVRYTIYLLQVADLRKKVIIERNHIKKQEKDQRNHKTVQMTQSFQNSISLQQSFYKSPTEVINSWIQERTQLSSKYREKYQQMKMQEMVDTVKYFESMKKLDHDREQQSDRKIALKKSVNDQKLQKAQSFNSKIESLKAKREEKQSDELLNNIKKREQYQEISRQRVIDIEEIQERMDRYNRRQKEVVNKKKELIYKHENRINIKDIEQEMNQSFMKRQKNLNEKSFQMTLSLKQLPQIQQKCSDNEINRKEKQLKGHLEKREKFTQYSGKLEENQKKGINEKRTIDKKKREEVSRNQQRLIEKLDKRVNIIQERLQKEEQNVIENEDEKYLELINKVEENRSRMTKNLTKNSEILDSLRQKSDIKLQNENDKYKQNVGLLRKREWAIEKMKHDRIMSLNKIDSLNIEKIKKEIDQQQQ